MSDLGANWKDWVRRFWWLRGVAAAITLAAIAPNYLNLSRYEFLRALHAIIVGWNMVAEILGDFIGKILFLPELSAATVNTAIFTLSVVIPTFIAVTKVHYVSDRLLEYIPISPQSHEANSIALAIVVVLMPFFYYEMATKGYSTDLYWTIILIIATPLFLILPVIVLPGFGRGVLFFLSFIVTVEVLYILQAPWLAEHINTLACDALSVPPEDCASDT